MFLYSYVLSIGIKVWVYGNALNGEYRGTTERPAAAFLAPAIKGKDHPRVAGQLAHHVPVCGVHIALAYAALALGVVPLGLSGAVVAGSLFAPVGALVLVAVKAAYALGQSVRRAAKQPQDEDAEEGEGGDKSTLSSRVASSAPGAIAWLDDAAAMSFSSTLRCDTQGFVWGGDSGMALLAWGLNLFWLCLALSPV